MKILLKWEKGSYSNLAINKYIPPHTSTKDRAFITQLVFGVIQHKLTLDYIISQISTIKIKKINIPVLNILRLGIYQILFLDRIPNHAIVNEAVNLTKKYNKKTTGFVNAVLRNAIRKKDHFKYPSREEELENYLSIYYSYPRWMINKWLKQYTPNFTENLCKALNEIPKLCIRTNTLHTSPEKLYNKLASMGIEIQRGNFIKKAVYLSNLPSMSILDCFKEGLFYIQDESSMIAPIVLKPTGEDLVLDVAAAPGGKTTHMAEIMGNKGIILAWDLYSHRIKLIKENCKRLGITNVKVKVNDARKLKGDYIGKFDKVLIDAPCSGLGVIRRKPDIKWSKKVEDINILKREQLNILSICSKYVKPGGILVYSTCTVGPEENKLVIEKFLCNHTEFEYEDIRPYLPNKLAKYVKPPYGYIEIFPNIHGIDGGFVCRLKKLG